MSNIKWSGIEKSKYGLTARWYVSAYYGNDIDVDSVGLYDPSTNVNGHGGKTRPFATLDKAAQQTAGTIVLDSGTYKASGDFARVIGDGICNIFNSTIGFGMNMISSNLNFIGCNFRTGYHAFEDSSFFYCTNVSTLGSVTNCIFVESELSAIYFNSKSIGCIYIRCSGARRSGAGENSIYIDCPSLTIWGSTPRPVATFNDYSIIIGTVKTNIPINGKTTGVTIEDFKADGNYFGRSYSEVDLFGNASGSGATAAQLKTLFCNYISPVYIDNYNELNLHLKTTAPDILKYGGLNGTFIGALPVMHWFDAENLWDNYRDAVNTVDLEKDAVTNAIRIVDLAEEGTFRSTRIDLDYPIIGNPAKFYANLVYNIEGTIKEGVSNQRIDTTPDMLPDNTKNQRVVYDFRLAIAPNDTDPLGAFKNYELDRSPTVDADGNSNIDDLFNQATEAKQEIGAFMIEFTMRKIIID